MLKEKIERVYKYHGWSEATIAPLLETSRQNLNSKLKGKDIGILFLKSIADATKIPLQEFINSVFEDEKPSAVYESTVEYEKMTIEEVSIALDKKLAEMQKQMEELGNQIKDINKKK